MEDPGQSGLCLLPQLWGDRNTGVLGVHWLAILAKLANTGGSWNPHLRKPRRSVIKEDA